MVGEQGVRLDVEREVLRRALDPQGRVSLRGWEVVRGVDLGDGELRGVEPQPFLGRVDTLRIEVPPLDQRRLRPRRDADQHPAALVPAYWILAILDPACGVDD